MQTIAKQPSMVVTLKAQGSDLDGAIAANLAAVGFAVPQGNASGRLSR